MMQRIHEEMKSSWRNEEFMKCGALLVTLEEGHQDRNMLTWENGKMYVTPKFLLW